MFISQFALPALYILCDPKPDCFPWDLEILFLFPKAAVFYFVTASLLLSDPWNCHWIAI